MVMKFSKVGVFIFSSILLFTLFSFNVEANLENLPTPFIFNGEWDTLIVSGQEGPSHYILAAMDIYLSFSQEAEIYPEDTGSILDIELENKTEKPLILIGGPNHNRITAELINFSYPTLCSESPKNCGYGVEEGILIFYENVFGGEFPAILVAGWTGEDVRKAAVVLANYKDYSLEDNCYIVTGTLESPVISECDIDLEYYKQFEVSEEINESLNNDSSYNENDTILEEELNNETEGVSIICYGCSFNGNCIAQGIRIEYEGKPLYCNLSNELIEQKNANYFCNSNYECKSNVCSNNLCFEPNFIKKILDFIKSIFKF